MDELKKVIKKYRAVDDQLRELNKSVTSLREERKCVELEMADLVKLPEFSAFNKFDLPDDGSVIRISRPEQYSKPWSMSQKDLTSIIQKYFQTDGLKTAEECVKFILQEKKKSLIATEFQFTRTVSED